MSDRGKMTVEKAIQRKQELEKERCQILDSLYSFSTLTNVSLLEEELKEKGKRGYTVNHDSFAPYKVEKSTKKCLQSIIEDEYVNKTSRILLNRFFEIENKLGRLLSTTLNVSNGRIGKEVTIGVGMSDEEALRLFKISCNILDGDSEELLNEKQKYTLESLYEELGSILKQRGRVK